MNNGNRILFWKDKWLNGQGPKLMFFALFKITNKKDATLQGMLVLSDNNNWYFALCRLLKEQEIEDVAHLLNLLPDIDRDSGRDQRVWQARTKGFSVA